MNNQMELWAYVWMDDGDSYSECIICRKLCHSLSVYYDNINVTYLCHKCGPIDGNTNVTSITDNGRLIVCYYKLRITTRNLQFECLKL